MSTTVADAIRKVTAAMQRELETGRRSRTLDAHDLLDALLAIADELAPPPPPPPAPSPQRRRPRRTG
jgi:hypothetical protein